MTTRNRDLASEAALIGRPGIHGSVAHDQATGAIAALLDARDAEAESYREHAIDLQGKLSDAEAESASLRVALEAARGALELWTLGSGYCMWCKMTVADCDADHGANKRCRGYVTREALAAIAALSTHSGEPTE